MIDDAAERERLRRKALIEKIRAENDAAPRPTLSGVQQAKVRARLYGLEEEGNDFAGVPVADLSELQRQAVLDEGRRNASAESTKPGGDGLVFKTHAAPRELANERQPVDDEFAAAEAPQPAADPNPWADWNRWCDARIAAALAGQHADVAELATATREFAEAVDQRMVEMQTQLNRLFTVLELLRARHDSKPVDAPTGFSRRVN